MEYIKCSEMKVRCPECIAIVLTVGEGMYAAIRELTYVCGECGHIGKVEWIAVHVKTEEGG